MWDCIVYIDDEMILNINRLLNGKGILYMIISYLYYYFIIVIWIRVFLKMKIWFLKVDFDEWY